MRTGYVPKRYPRVSETFVRVEQLHAHFLGESVATTYQASLLTGIPFSISTHAKDLYTARPSSIGFFAKQTHFIATCTDFNVCYLRSILPPDHVHTIHTVFHGVDTGRFRPPATRPGNSVPRIISVGRLVPEKGHEHLVPPADPASLATALRTLLQSEGLRRQLGTAARATVVERFDATQNADALASIFGMEGEVGAHRVPGA